MESWKVGQENQINIRSFEANIWQLLSKHFEELKWLKMLWHWTLNPYIKPHIFYITYILFKISNLYNRSEKPYFQTLTRIDHQWIISGIQLCKHGHTTLHPMRLLGCFWELEVLLMSNWIASGTMDIWYVRLKSYYEIIHLWVVYDPTH